MISNTYGKTKIRFSLPPAPSAPQLMPEKLSQEELHQIQKKHDDWFGAYRLRWDSKEAQLDSRKANLSGAYLSGVNLSGAKFNFANLSEAYLFDANLSWAYLSEANLIGAKLQKSNLTGAYLYGADLSGADMTEANLSGANLYGADLSGADLSGADLTGANLSWSDVTRARLNFKSLPGVSNMFAIQGLSTIKITDVSPIVKLRQTFKEAGSKREEKALTSALYQYQLQSMSTAEQFFSKYILGGYITDYGANPFGAFRTLVIFIPVFLCLYFLILIKPARASGIWRIWPKERILKPVGQNDTELLRYQGSKGWCLALLYALYFSFLSAFHFGWRDLNISSWIVRMQKREYVLRATGYARMISGIQSLISLYLMALWLLTYFGSPFE